MKETRRQRFRRLAIYRTNAVLEKLRVLENLSNRINYDYTDDEVKKIFLTIDKRVKEARNKFHSSKIRKRDFTL